MAGILRALTQVLHIWWTKDRIRVARNEGKLFRIDVGDRLLIEDKIFRVVARHDDSNEEFAQVFYSLAELLAESTTESLAEEQNCAWSLRFTMHSDHASLCHQSRELEIECDRVLVLERQSIAGR
ncbi:MAG: hypothetical protein SFV81_08390 [Pirellulaceae bacterium]|nr:hypothetical protein [Pirellulaceae bacterium]